MEYELPHDREEETTKSLVASPSADTEALVIDNLWIRAKTSARKYLVAGVSVRVPRGECVGLLGESGCGKTLTALSILNLVPGSAGVIECGEIRYDGINLLSVSEKEMRRVRGNRIAMVFQEAQAALNPVLRIGEQLAETLRTHRNATAKEARSAAIHALRKMQIAPAESWIDAYPHELSGGMQQRVLLAMALMCGPDFLVADEPTSSLDLVLQAEIMRQLDKHRRELDVGILLITHDIALVAEYCQRIAVMYRGMLMEAGDVRHVLGNPKHPYSLHLLRSHPDWQPVAISPNAPPSPGAGVRREIQEMSDPTGQETCAYRKLCPRALSICQLEMPAWQNASAEHQFRCWNPLPKGDGITLEHRSDVKTQDGNDG